MRQECDIVEDVKYEDRCEAVQVLICLYRLYASIYLYFCASIYYEMIQKSDIKKDVS